MDSVPVEPRSVFTAALLTHVPAVIMAHNHPSCDPEPSPQDILLTRRLVRCGGILGIPVLDHLVIGAGCWSSMGALYPGCWEGERP